MGFFLLFPDKAASIEKCENWYVGTVKQFVEQNSYTYRGNKGRRWISYKT